jgi:cysteine desulfurase
MDKIIYLDHAATTSIKEDVLNEIYPFLTKNYGNASSNYSLGRNSLHAIEIARQRVAIALNCEPGEVIFTSGGTESDNWAIKGIALANKSKGNHIITSSIEHPAVIKSCKFLERNGFEVTYLPVDGDGAISIKDLEASIRENTILISIMFANNEVGTIQPIEEIGKIAKKHNIYFHTDAVQAIGNIDINVNRLCIDLLSLSAHKFNGPKGIGALYIRNGVIIDSYVNGGLQENNRRAGTENVAGIVGLGKAIELATTDINIKSQKISKIRNGFIKDIIESIPNYELNGHPTNRLPGNANISFYPIDSKKLISLLDKYGILVSNGSACSCKSNSASQVLLAMKKDKNVASCSIRFTFGEENTKEEVNYVVSILKQEIDSLMNKK